MVKAEYLSRLRSELKKNNIPDAEEILSEYEQHFAFKLADGFCEEEIAAKLGDPAALAAQFTAGAKRDSLGKKAVACIGLAFLDLFAGTFFVLLFAWEAVMVACAIASAAIGVCLLGGLNIYGILPSLPYGCGVLFAAACLAFAVFSAVGFIYFGSFIRQLMRSYGRFHHNAFAFAAGRIPLPAIAAYPQFSKKANRRLRAAALFSLTIFAVCAIAAFVVSVLASGALEFWHAWRWFM